MTTNQQQGKCEKILCTKCKAPFLSHHHQHTTPTGVYHTSCQPATPKESADQSGDTNELVESAKCDHCFHNYDGECCKCGVVADEEPVEANAKSPSNEGLSASRKDSPDVNSPSIPPESAEGEGWEERFLEKQINDEFCTWKEIPTHWHSDWETIKSFIRSILSQRDRHHTAEVGEWREELIQLIDIWACPDDRRLILKYILPLISRHITVAYEKGVAEEAKGCYDHSEKARKEGYAKGKEETIAECTSILNEASYDKGYKKGKEERQELADALLDMYDQYCDHGHDFMSAGERASTVLEMQDYATFDDAGRRLTQLDKIKPWERNL